MLQMGRKKMDPLRDEERKKDRALSVWGGGGGGGGGRRGYVFLILLSGSMGVLKDRRKGDQNVHHCVRSSQTGGRVAEIKSTAGGRKTVIIGK